MPTPSAHVSKLDEYLKPHEQSIDILNKALKEVAEEEGEEKLKKAKDLVRKGLELKRQREQTERDFNGQMKKFDKELGKTIRRLENMASGKPLDEGVSDKEESKGDSDGGDTAGS